MIQTIVSYRMPWCGLDHKWSFLCRRCPPQCRSHSCPDTSVSLTDGIGANFLAAHPRWSRIDESHALYKRPASGNCGGYCLPKCVSDNNHSTPDTGPPTAGGRPIHWTNRSPTVWSWHSCPPIWYAGLSQIQCWHGFFLDDGLNPRLGQTDDTPGNTVNSGFKHAPPALRTIFLHFEHFSYVACVPASAFQLFAYRRTDWRSTAFLTFEQAKIIFLDAFAVHAGFLLYHPVHTIRPPFSLLSPAPDWANWHLGDRRRLRGNRWRPRPVFHCWADCSPHLDHVFRCLRFGNWCLQNCCHVFLTESYLKHYQFGRSERTCSVFFHLGKILQIRVLPDVFHLLFYQ